MPAAAAAGGWGGGGEAAGQVGAGMVLGRLAGAGQACGVRELTPEQLLPICVRKVPPKRVRPPGDGPQS